MWCAVSAHRVGCQVLQWTILLIVLLVSILILLAEVVPPAFAQDTKATSMNVMLPQSVGVWTASRPPMHIGAKDIFDYMDGAGELYLGYRFDRLDAYEYESAKDDNILVELYWMQSSDDAYGLISTDWGGEPVNFHPGGDGNAVHELRALYGAGLLRIWSGNLYARVMAYQETEASRRAVLELGKAIVAGRTDSPRPKLAETLPTSVSGRFTQPGAPVFLRSHLVLNSVYFLGSENLLDLALECEVVVASYVQPELPKPQKKIRVLVARYPTEAAARNALAHFRKVYLADKPGKSNSSDYGTVSIEDGWAGFVLAGKGIGLVFQAPDEPSTRLFLDSSKQALKTVEELHE